MIDYLKIYRISTQFQTEIVSKDTKIPPLNFPFTLEVRTYTVIHTNYCRMQIFII